MVQNKAPVYRGYFIADARVITCADEPARLRFWLEKRGEVEPEDLSTNPNVQFGLVE
jgi:hypothetical protein